MNTQNGALHFENMLDNKQFVSAIAESTKRIQGMSDATVAAGDKIDKALDNITDKAQEQKKAFKSLAEEMKYVYQQMMNSIKVGDTKGADEYSARLSVLRGKLDEATQAEKAFNAEHAEAIARNKELISQQKEAVVQDEKGVVSKSGLISSLSKWATGLFSVAAVLKIVKDVIASTEGTADKFEEAVGLLKGGFEGLYRTIATGQWDQLIRNIVNAAKATRDLKAATNELTHIVAGGTIERADLLAGLEKARANAAAAINSSEQKKYLDEAIDFQKQITALNVSEIKDRLAIDEDYYFKLTGHSKEYYDYLLQQIPIIAKNYKTFYNQQEGNQLRLNQLKYLESSQSGGLTKAQEKERHELQLLLFTLQDYKILQEDLSKKGQWDEYIKGIGEMRTAAAQGDQALVNLTRQSATAGKAAAKGIGDIDKQIADQIELLNKAVADGNTNEVKAIADKILLLERELDVRVKIAKAAILSSMTEKHGNVTAIDTSHINIGVPLVAPDLPGLQQASTQAQAGAALGAAREWNVEDYAKDEAADKKKKEALEDQLKLRQQIVEAVASLVSQIGQEIGLNEKSTVLLNAGLSAFTQLASGDLPGAAMSMLSGIIAQIPSAASRFEKQIEHINQLLEKQQRIIELSERKGGQETARKDEITYLNQKAAAEKAEYERLQKSADKHLDLLGWRQDKADKAYATWQATTQQIEDSNYALEDFYTGTTAYAVADAIAQGFQDGKTSAADFADTFNGFMITAINNALEEMSKPAWAAWTAKFAKYMAGGLTDAERADLKIDFDKNVADGKATRDEAYRIAGVSPTTAGNLSQDSLKGSIKGVTEQTASVLAGQMNAIRITQVDSNGLIRQQLQCMTEIAANSRYLHLLDHLTSIDNKLSAGSDLRAQGMI